MIPVKAGNELTCIPKLGKDWSTGFDESRGALAFG